jgi:hypothetical protein
MWAIAMRNRDVPLNEMTIPWRVQGPLQVDALEAALFDLVARHPTLRARLELRRGQLFQVSQPPEAVPIERVAVDGDTEDDRLKAAISRLYDGAGKMIDVVAGPPVRVRLIRMATDDHVLCLFVHHSMCDGASISVIVRDLMAFYVAHLRGASADLPRLEEQYADLAAWEIATYTSGGFAEEIRYWRAELADLPPPALLPTRATRKGNRDWRAASRRSFESPATLAGLRDLARQFRVSAYALLMSALAVLLHQRTGASDLLIGVATLNRWSSKSMNFVGCATSLLPARVRVNAAAGFAAQCGQVHATIRRMLAYGRIPMELVLRETQDTLLAGPVFPYWCQFLEDAGPTVVKDAGVTLTPLPTDRRTLLSDLDLDMVGSSSGLQCEFAHRRALFDEAMIDAFMQDYSSVLHVAMRNPGISVEGLVEEAIMTRAASS